MFSNYGVGVGWVERSETQLGVRKMLGYSAPSPFGSTLLKRHFSQRGEPVHKSGSPTYN